MPARVQFWCKVVVHLLVITFALALLVGGGLMAVSTHGSTIPTLGLSEAVRYAPVLASGVLISLFSIEHLIALSTGKKVEPSWH
jgi:TRAP-type C4-dicarboxylate transport system permease small subunit